MANPTVFIDFKIGDTSAITDKATQLTEKEQKAFEDGNKELDKRLEKEKEITAEQEKRIPNTTKEVQAEKDATTAAGKRLSKQKEITAETAKTVKAVNDGQNATVKNIIALGQELDVHKKINDAFQKQFVSAKTVGDQIIALGNVFQTAFDINGNEGVTEVFNELQSQIAGTGLTVDEFVQKLKEVDPATSIVAEKQNKLTTDLRNVRNEMAQLIVNGQRNSEEYENLSKKAVELAAAQQRVNATIKDGTKSNEIITGTAEVVEGLTAGFELLTAGMQIFGKENEDVVNTIKFLNTVMVASNGIQQVTTILKNKDNVVTKALTTAYNFLTTSIYGTTTGLSAFDSALAASGIGVFIVAIGLAIGKLITWVQELYNANDAMEATQNIIKNTNDLFDTRAKRIENDGKLEQERAKRSTDASRAMYEADKQTTQQLIENERAHLAEAKKTSEQLTDVNSKLYQSYRLDEETRRKAQQESFANEVSIIDKITALKEKQRLEDSKEETRRYTEAQRAAEQAAQKQQQLDEQAAARRKEIKQANAEAVRQIEDRTTNYLIENETKVSENDKEAYQTRLNALENANTLRNQQIEKQRQREKDDLVASGKATTDQLLNIDDKYNTERDKLYNDYWDKRRSLEAENRAALAEADLTSQQNVIKARLDIAQKGTQNELELTNDLIRLQAEAEKTRITNSVTNEKLRAAQIEAVNLEMNKRINDNNEAYARERLQDATELEKAVHDLAIAQANASLVGVDANSPRAFNAAQDARKKYLQETLDEMARLDYAFQSGQLKDEKQYQKDREKLEVEAANRRVDILKAEADRRKEINNAIRDAAFDIAQQVSDAVFSAGDEKRQAQLDKQQEQLDKARQNELDNANLTEQQKEQINQRFDAKERQLKRRAAEQDKQAAITQATINAALAVTKAFASLVWPFNLIQAAAVSIAAGIQIAKIKSTPLPAYEKGTKYAKRGQAITGEKGAELQYMQGGEIVLTHQETQRVLQYASTHQAVNAAMEKAINRNYVNETTAPNLAIDYHKLGAEVGKQFRKHAVRINTTIDKEGFGQMMEQGNARTRYLNKRYSL